MHTFWIVLAAVFSALPTHAFAEPITVLVHNYAVVSEPSLETAEAEAARILGTAGVLIRRVQCPDASEAPRECHPLPGPMVLVVQLLPARATRHNVEPGALGFALQPECHGFGSYADVLCDRVDRLHSARISKSALLGAIIAHELGHLLLGAASHTNGGIMQAEWRIPELDAVAQGSMVFRNKERRRIQENVRFRRAGARHPLIHTQKATRIKYPEPCAADDANSALPIH